MEDTHIVNHRGDGQTVAVSDGHKPLEQPDERIISELIGSEAVSTGESQNAQSTPLESATTTSPVPRPPSRAGSITHVKLSSCRSREALHSSVQEVIEEINAKRKQDTQILADFKKAMEMQVNKMCNLVEQQMFRTYDREGKNIQSKLTELFATLDRIAQIETELQQFKQALQILYQEMQHGD